MRIFKTGWFTRFARREKISHEALREAVHRVENGQIDADLGGGVLKQRVACHGRGKSKGYRTIIVYRAGDKAFFVYGFSKSDRTDIREDEEKQFKKMAKHVLTLPDSRLRILIATGQFEEVGSEDKEVSK